MNFNHEQYRKYRRAAGVAAKNGIWDITVFPNGLYCFVLGQKLGINGKIDSHPLLNKRFKNVNSGKEYVLDSVCVHWYDGYYYHATLRDENNSHATVIIGNINCENDICLDGLKHFNETYIPLD